MIYFTHFLLRYLLIVGNGSHTSPLTWMRREILRSDGRDIQSSLKLFGIKLPRMYPDRMRTGYCLVSLTIFTFHFLHLFLPAGKNIDFSALHTGVSAYREIKKTEVLQHMLIEDCENRLPSITKLSRHSRDEGGP